MILRPSDPYPKGGKIPCLVDPIIPARAIILLHGDEASGKSPLTWSLANAVSRPSPLWFGLSCTYASTLYLELDTPAEIVTEKWKAAGFQRSFYVAFLESEGMDVLSPRFDRSKAYEEIQKAKHGLLQDTNGKEDEFGFVIVNTLRKVHGEEDVKSYVPSAVYRAFRTLFPGAALLFVHHNNKAGAYNPLLQSNAKSSGSKAWVNDCQVRLEIVGYKYDKATNVLDLVLDQGKNHTGRPFGPMSLRVESDSVTMVEP